ncbi:MAG: hypothetical protein HC817_07960 [Saprospiraceae bacterium]|nr:hypothetical protein [Saprospiraceae bacterium]
MDTPESRTNVPPIKRRFDLAQKTSFSSVSKNEKEEKTRRTIEVPQVGRRKSSPSASLSYSPNASRSNSRSSYRAYEKKSFFSFLFGKKIKKRT